MRDLLGWKCVLLASVVCLAACGGGSGTAPAPTPFTDVAGTFSGFQFLKNSTGTGLDADGAIQLSIAATGAVTDELGGELSGSLQAIDSGAAPGALTLTTTVGEIVVLQFDTATQSTYFTMLNADRFAVCQRGLDAQTPQSIGLVGDGAWAGLNGSYTFGSTTTGADVNTRVAIQAATADLGGISFTFVHQDLAATTTVNSTAANPPIAPLAPLPFVFLGGWTQDIPTREGAVLLMPSPDGQFLGSIFFDGTVNAPHVATMATSVIGSWTRN